jgi:large subunit ribosomal protein L5
MARLKELYKTELAPRLMQELQLANVMEVPRVIKVVVNMGLGEAIQNIKVLEGAVEELSRITGQKAVITRAKRSIASFKLREGMPIGCMVTLRRERAYEFLDRLLNVGLPRVRDFKGVPPRASTVAATTRWGFASS